ncbi:unnamed protein product, partial [Prorocentrum cordatum]
VGLELLRQEKGADMRIAERSLDGALPQAPAAAAGAGPAGAVPAPSRLGRGGAEAAGGGPPERPQRQGRWQERGQGCKVLIDGSWTIGKLVEQSGDMCFVSIYSSNKQVRTIQVPRNRLLDLKGHPFFPDSQAGEPKQRPAGPSAAQPRGRPSSSAAVEGARSVLDVIDCADSE